MARFIRLLFNQTKFKLNEDNIISSVFLLFFIDNDCTTHAGGLACNEKTHF